jgi:hypothetical protein
MRHHQAESKKQKVKGLVNKLSALCFVLKAYGKRSIYFS